jgi:hypothetical protein
MSRLGHQLIATSDTPWTHAPGVHSLTLGASGGGKTFGTLSAIRSRLLNSAAAQVIIDPEGELAGHLVDFAARHPLGRKVHVLRSASATESFGFGLLDVDPDDLQACHDAALLALAVLEQVVSFGSPEYGPRTEKLILLALVALARRGLPVVVMPEIYATESGARALLAEGLAFPFMINEWQGLDVLAERNPRGFIDYRDSVISRALKILAAPRVRRIFGQSRGRNVNLRRVLTEGDLLILDLSGTPSEQAVLIGTSLAAMIYNLALSFPITGTPVADIWIDESPDFIIPAITKGFERTRKRGVFWHLLAQQPTMYVKPNDPHGAVLATIMTNARLHTVFGGLTQESAELIAKCDCLGHLELDTIWKPGSTRPVVTGLDKVRLASEAAARHHLESQARATSETTAHARMRGKSAATSAQWADMSFSGLASSSASLPDTGLLTPATPLSFTEASNRGHGSTRAGGMTRGTHSAEQEAAARAMSESTGRADGQSAAHGSHEAYVPRYADLPTESYSLEEKMAAVIGRIMTLPPRTCLRKLGAEPPVICRTPDLEPAFRSDPFRRQAVPLFLAKARRESPYLRPTAEIDAEIAAELARLEPPFVEIVETDFSAPEPSPRPRPGENRS